MFLRLFRENSTKKIVNSNFFISLLPSLSPLKWIWMEQGFSLCLLQISSFSSLSLARYFRGEHQRRHRRRQGIWKFSILNDITVFVAKPQSNVCLTSKSLLGVFRWRTKKPRKSFSMIRAWKIEKFSTIFLKITTQELFSSSIWLHVQ